MDTFSPPFEPQNAPVPPMQTPETLPTSTPITAGATIGQTQRNSWKIVLFFGILLFLSGVGGYIFLWMNQ